MNRILLAEMVLVQLRQTKAQTGAGVGSNFNCVNNEPWDTQHVHKHQEDRQKHTSAGIPFRIFILLKPGQFLIEVKWISLIFKKTAL